MKKIIKLIMLKLIMLTCLLSNTETYSQGTFQAAAATETNVNITSTRKIGSDILDVSSDIYRVFSWADASSSARLDWRVKYSSTTYLSNANLAYTGNITETDVCLVIGGSDVYALVVYYDATNTRIIYERFKWNTMTTLFASQGSNIIASNVSPCYAANIDADENGNFIFVWDDNGDTYGQYGIISSSVPALSGSPVRIVASTGYAPDVCIYDPDNIYFTYVTTPLSGLKVDHTDNSMASTANQLSATGQGYPRIACPNQQNGSSEDWSVVTTYSYTSVFITYWDIIAYVCDASNVQGPIVCNSSAGNGLGLGNINRVESIEPVIAYDSQSAYEIWVAWTFNNSSNHYTTGGAVDAEYPIGVGMDNTGAATVAKYWDVPSSLSANEVHLCASLAGRHSDSNNEKLLVSYMDDDNDDLVIKSDIAINGASSFRETGDTMPGAETIYSMQNLFANTDATKKYTLRVFDLTGKNVVTLTGNITYLKNLLVEQCKLLDKSVYFVELKSNDNATQAIAKVFTGNN